MACIDHLRSHQALFVVVPLTKEHAEVQRDDLVDGRTILKEAEQFLFGGT